MGKLVPLEKILDGGVRDKQLVRVAGLVTKVKRSTTKKGDTMAFATLEDYTRDIETVVFPKIFYEGTELLAEDKPVVIQGRVDMAETGTKLIADKIWPMEGYRTEYFIMTNTAQATEQNYACLRAVAKEHHGEHKVQLYLTDRRKNTPLAQDYWLDGSPEAKAALEKIFGLGSVKER